MTGSPDPHDDRQFRCESENAGRILRAQVQRKQAFELIRPILADDFIRPKTEKRLVFYAPDRLTLRLVALGLILMLGACGSPAVFRIEPGMKQTRQGKTATPGVPAIQTRSRAVRPIPRPSVIPERLVISAIGINALIESVGVRSDGDLATPTRIPWDDVGWYSLGPHPGERGSAVIDGHLDRPGGLPAIFWRLRDIQVGNHIQVINSSGQTLQFRVSRIAYYTPDQAPLQDIFGNLGGTYLNLITCAGDWIPDQHQTTLRLVVYAIFV